MNISGILVQVTPRYLNFVVDRIKEADFCEYHQHDELGRIVVTIEGDTAEDEIAKLKLLQQVEHVVSADMVFSHSEDELDKLRQGLDTSSPVPEWLNDPNVMAEDIVYHGDLKKKKQNVLKKLDW